MKLKEGVGLTLQATWTLKREVSGRPAMALHDERALFQPDRKAEFLALVLLCTDVAPMPT